jgi:hypothetical protein
MRVEIRHTVPTLDRSGVDVTKTVKQWSSSPEFGSEMGTSNVVEIQMTLWRTVGNKNINVVRYSIMPNVQSAKVLEGPVSPLWGPWASMKFS